MALELENEMRRRGSDPSFPSIVAGGANGALPHARPGEDPIASDTLVVVDLGCVVDGYCSDCTRTFATGPLPDELKEAYEVCLEAQLAALDAVRPGAVGRDVDAVARGRISAAGFGEAFGHGLGHGVGLDIHEAPSVAVTSTDTLAAGHVVTVEPGVYLPEHGGVRIEDSVVVTDTGCRPLTHTSKELIV